MTIKPKYVVGDSEYFSVSRGDWDKMISNSVTFYRWRVKIGPLEIRWNGWKIPPRALFSARTFRMVITLGRRQWLWYR